MKLIELVPRSIEEVVAQAKELVTRFSFLDGVNIPDVVRLPLRSHDVALALAGEGITAIPHIRCIDRPLEESVALVERLKAGGVTQVLIVSGDRPKGPATTFDMSPLDLIPAIKSQVSGVIVYAGVDPYRSNVTAEIEYAQKKHLAGADGFFSQPFFDLHFAQYYAQLLSHSSCFLGVAPVTSPASKTYWETVNQVVFGNHFELSLEYNARFAANMFRLADHLNTHVYLMPIKVDPAVYLTEIEGFL